MGTFDPGVRETLERGAQDVKSDSIKEEEDEEDNFDPSRWWFASTACPLLAGTLGPVANGLSICALVYRWRVFIPPKGTEDNGIPIEDPNWLVAINAVSLVAALIANASLLLNMARRLSFIVAQPITIAGFLLAGILLIADMAALTSSPTYYITDPAQQPAFSHALSSAFYYAIFASSLYIGIGFIMCITVYGANKGYYRKDFNLTPSQRTLMLQTMLFVAYLLLGAFVYSKIEGWDYLDAVYWADVTLLTVGLGDFSPQTKMGRGLLFPFAIGGILIVGLVIGSIRSLVLERGKEKLGARITEKRRFTAVHNVDECKQTIRISWLASADFNTDPTMSSAQRREEEFAVMRKVQAAAENERMWFGLVTSIAFALALWFVGAAVFMACEQTQSWTYFESLYFTYVCLLTIGYGDPAPVSNSGRAFFVIWSLLAVPSLTILISNMGDTFVKWFSDLTIWIGSVTVLPSEHGIRATAKPFICRMLESAHIGGTRFTAPGMLGNVPIPASKPSNSEKHRNQLMDRLAERLEQHIGKEELDQAQQAENEGDDLKRDIHFYHYVLSRECRNLQRDLSASPPKKYSWHDWEYYLKLMGNDDQESGNDESLVPLVLQHAPNCGVDSPAFEYQGLEDHPAQLDGIVGRDTERREFQEAHERNKKCHKAGKKRRPTILDLKDWSWLSNKSPLMGTQSEAEWILERLSTALERELNRQRKGIERKPPVGMADMKRTMRTKEEKKQEEQEEKTK
ncbi:putative potassium channel isoform 2A [Acrodontium crateriforme]|uniref:Potassium channel isoform 2A n=1 Tax=Acrodontium crateriforme TaxID=150365 RepID=A0AAQ3R8B7_9PEZI|nr:putative potassium channel isoform 2A [Acrodontium crateriforme]